MDSTIKVVKGTLRVRYWTFNGRVKEKLAAPNETNF